MLLELESRFLYNRLLSELQPFSIDPQGQLANIQESLLVCMTYLEELYSLLRVTEFEDSKEEVQFFKYVKPKFSVEVEFRLRLSRAIELGIDTGSNPEMEIAQMRKLFSEYGDFVSYYREGLTHNDHAWFIQGQMPLPTRLCLLPTEENPRFTSARDRWISGLVAIERYNEWLNSKLI